MKRQILISPLILLFAAGFATAATLNVPGDYSTIQAAIDDAEVGDMVLVALGDYYETIDFSDAEACIVTSTNPLDPDIVAGTVINGTGIGGSVVTFGPIDDPNFFLPRDDPNFIEFALSGFTITGGDAGFGGGIFCDANSVPTIRYCHIVDNQARDMGMYEGDGGGVYLTSSSARFMGCWIANNSAEWWGGGVYCEGQAELGEGEPFPPEFFNCLITNNQSLDYGGAIYCFDSSPVITLCTIVNNSGYYDPDIHGTVESDLNGYGGVYCVGESSPTITNCIIWGNGDDLYGCAATYSCIEDGDGGGGNIDDNPLFVRGPFAEIISGGFGDYYLSQLAGRQLVDSPCVNAGTGAIRDYLDDYIVLYGLGPITTCTENIPDTSLVDMGYHYNYYYGPPIMYELKIFVVGNGTTNPTPDPNSHFYPMYTQVPITAIPDPNHRVKQWIGTDNDLSFASFNTVIMDSDKNVSVEFELSYPSTLDVGAGYEYTVIQDAINDARDGDIVMIHSGTYPSQAGCTVIGKDITITGTNPSDPNIVAATVVDCDGESSGGFDIFGSGSGSCVLKGITIINSHTVVLTPFHGINRPAGSRGFDGGAHMGGGALSVFGNHTVVNCVIRNCSVEGGDADYGWDGNNDVPGGDGGDGGDAAGAGIYIGWGNPLIKNCTVDNCIATGGDGGAGANGGNPTSGGDGGVTGRAMGGGVYYAAGTSPTFIDCNITNCQAIGGTGGDGGDATGIAGVGGYGGLTYYDPGQGDPASYSAYGGGGHGASFTNVTFTGCTFSNNVSDGSVSGQGGLSASGVQNQPRQNFNIPSYGAGAYCDIGSFTTLANCTFQGNLANYYANQYTGYGGGICFEFASYAELKDCNIIDNNAPVGGGVYGSAVADFHVLDCNFVDNSAYIGGGLSSIDSVGNISGCTISGNSADDPDESIYGAGGGLFCFASEALVSDCLISNNTASGSGGGVHFGGDPETITPFYGAPTLKNCLVLNNTAGRDGGGISCDWYSEPNIVNCTITGNEAKGDPPFYVGYGGGLYCTYESDVNIINSIVWGNAGPNTFGPELAVETWFGFEPTTLTVSHCDIEGGQEEVWVDDYSTLNWVTGNIYKNPLFIDGYHLSHIEAGQIADSPCVDAGKGSVADLGLQNYTTRTDSVPDVCDVDMGYHYPHIIMEVSCDFDADGDVDMADLAILLSYWLEQDCDLLAWCEGADLDRDKDVDFVDYAIFTQAYAPFEDTYPPEPDPSTWEIEPYEISPFTISMIATTATDESGTVEYFFSCTSGGGNSSGWQVSSTYQDIVVAETTYCYTVKTRDLYLNETLPSVERCVLVEGDEAAPQPDPSEWEIEPHPLSSSAIHMMAVTAYDPSGGVQYQFECVGGGGHSSDWQGSSEYTDTGLAALTEYTYRVRTRDVHENTGDYSEPQSATTLPGG